MRKVPIAASPMSRPTLLLSCSSALDRRSAVKFGCRDGDDGAE